MVRLFSYPACVVPQGVPIYNLIDPYISMHYQLISYQLNADCKTFRSDTGASQMSPQLGKQRRRSRPNLPNVVLTATISTMVLILVPNEPNVLPIRAEFASRLPDICILPYACAAKIATDQLALRDQRPGPL